MQRDFQLACTSEARRDASRAATELLAANDNETAKPRIRYRGGRPALNWLAKHDAVGAASLWMIARDRLPVAANDNTPPKELSLDRRKDGTPRGKANTPFRAGEYLDLPAATPSPLHADPYQRPIAARSWFNASGMAMRPQRDCHNYHEHCRHGFCAPGVARQYGSLVESVGQRRPGVSRGDPRQVDGREWPEPADRVSYVIELSLAGEGVAGVGAALGGKGRYADVVGKKALREAAEWAKGVVAEVYQPSN